MTTATAGTRTLLTLTLLLAGAADGTYAQTPAPNAGVQPGIDVLIADRFQPLAGKRVGLITNPTGVTSDLRSTIDVLYQTPEVQLVTLFGPEHGVRGEVTAGGNIADASDPLTGLPIRSLYGKHRKPTPEMLAGLDVLVFDIQDIGSRSYTYISTMAVALEAAAENNIAFVVLDRPNPLTGERIEGRPLDLEYKSFVGYLPIPYVHGLTVGELATMINGEGWLAGAVRCDLHVVRMKGWRRDMWFDQTGLKWVLTSPHIPRADTALFYAATGIMGELRVLSEGVGYTLPFELAGAPGLDPQRLADELNRRQLPGVYFRPLLWRPYYASYAEQTCGGVQLHLTNRDRVELTALQFHVMDAVRQVNPDRKLFGNKRDRMFDKVCGTARIRQLFEQGRPLDEILAVWHEGLDEFRMLRERYLLYD
ncbi:MAG: DUF1343 domain-containing protein [Planctomycetes bacterium]|nr:DUF1343 domain-containing protein [Planctomycetota bacterium]